MSGRVLTHAGTVARRPMRPPRDAGRREAGPGVVQLHGAVDAAACSAWSRIAERAIEDGLSGRIDAPEWSAASTSVRLSACRGLALANLLSRLWRGPLRRASFDRLGPRAVCDLDQCWLRRRYPQAEARPGHPSHAWHQDGALGIDFTAAGAMPGEPESRLLDVVTFWIPLAPCGRDAPGLELIATPPGKLLRPDELETARLRETHAADAFVRPLMAAGDALVFGGDVVHRTHLAPSMTRARTSLELRCFPGGSLPVRLAGDRWARLPALQ